MEDTMPPLTAEDLEKITVIVERATSRIERDLQGMMPRGEYEKRHEELYNRTVQNEARINEMARWALTEHEKLTTTLNTRHEESMHAINDLKEQISQSKSTTLRYIISVIVSFVLGGGILEGLIKLFGGGK